MRSCLRESRKRIRPALESLPLRINTGRSCCGLEGVARGFLLNIPPGRVGGGGGCKVNMARMRGGALCQKHKRPIRERARMTRRLFQAALVNEPRSLRAGREGTRKDETSRNGCRYQRMSNVAGCHMVSPPAASSSRGRPLARSPGSDNTRGPFLSRGGKLQHV